METKYKTFPILEVVLMVLAVTFTAVGCERKLTKSPAEQAQSLNETALAGTEAEELGVIIERNVPVPMRDGVILRADVYRPDRGGPYPVLVQRSLFNKDNVAQNINQLVKAGYIVVIQVGRGFDESEGKYNPEELQRYEAEDGYDTVEWAAKLPGSSHKVGTFGKSLGARMQWLLAPLRPPSLVAMCAQSSYVHAWDTYPTGAFSPAHYLWGTLTILNPNQRKRANLPGVHTRWEAQILWEKDSEKWINWLPWFDLPREILNEVIRNYLNDPSFEAVDLPEGCKDISVPNFDITGWYDFDNGDLLMFRTMVNKAKTKVARKGSRIIIGPWSHNTPGERRVGDIDFGPNANIDTTALQIRWFDYWLKEKSNGVDKEPPVRIFVMGDNEWRDEQCWPPQETKERILFLSSGGRANTPRGNGKLVQQKPEQSSKDQYLYDPKDPVPTLFDLPTLYLFPNDQRPLANREDILVYQSEPLTERVEVTGNPVVEFYAASSAPDTDWFVRLIDVAPDGFARNVSEGAVRARYRNGFDKPKLLKPGEVVKYTIRMRPTSNAFLSRHRIRLDITSSDFPNLDRNHNTAANQNADATLVTANQTIYHGGERATRIILPWVPNPPEEEKPEPEPERQMYQLHQAAADGDIEQVKLLISKGADVNREDEEKKTPLHYAAQTGKMEVVQLLIKAGVDLNCKDKEHQTPMTLARNNWHVGLVKLLVSEGADVDLESAAYLGDLAKVKRFIESDPDINESQLNQLLRWSLDYESLLQGHKDVADYLLDKGANPNAKYENDATLLHLSAWGGDPALTKSVIEFLVSNGADVNALQGESRWTPLHSACSQGRGSVAKVLIDNGADVNAKNKWGHSPLYYANQKGDLDTMKLLIAKGADIEINRPEGLTSLHYMSTYGSGDIVERLLAKGAKVDERDEVYEFTALHYAARFGHKNMAELLIANGADINAKDKWDYQPIHWAAHHDRADVVELLISKGVDINSKTSLNQTPLQLAQERRNTKTIELLSKHGEKD